MHLGLDLGTSALKGLLIDDEQNIIAQASAATTVMRPSEGWSEQAPDQWIKAAEKVFSRLAQLSDLSSLQSIGLSGQMHGATLLDKDDKVLRPSILWNDTRSQSEAAKMDLDPEFRSVSGNIVFPGFTAPKLLWVRHNEPAIFEKIAMVLLPKDYVRLWLIGEHVTDMSDAAGTSWLNTEKRIWSDNLLKKTGLTHAQMPELVEGSEASGVLRKSLRDKFGISGNVVVAGGGGDNAASGIGVGVSKTGDAFVSLGTSGVLFAACEGYYPNAESAVHTFCHALPGTWHHMTVLLSATDSLNWYAKLVNRSPADLTDCLKELQAPEKTLFLPCLGGERTPHNDASIRGAFLGLEHLTDTEAGTRAILEGVVHGFRDCLDALKAAGTTINNITAVGGGAKSDYWLKALATSLDLTIDVPVSGEFGAALGAARLGMISTGSGVDVIQRPPITGTIQPDKNLQQAFTDAHGRFQNAYRMIKKL